MSCKHIILIIPLVFIFIALLVEPAAAWGPGAHIHWGANMFRYLGEFAPEAAGLIRAYPYDYLYGCIGADITVGKRFAKAKEHCHNWSVGRDILGAARTEAQRSFAYGYLSHLAADVVAHNYFIPHKIVTSHDLRAKGHAYWEMRVDTLYLPDLAGLARKTAQLADHDDDVLIREIVARTIFSFRTNKRIFNTVLRLNDLEAWQRLTRLYHSQSKLQLVEEEVEEFHQLSLASIKSLLKDPLNAPCMEIDPTGQKNLDLAFLVRRNMRKAANGRKRLAPEEADAIISSARSRFRSSLNGLD